MASQSAPFSYVPLHPCTTSSLGWLRSRPHSRTSLCTPAPLLLWDGFAVGPVLVRPFAPLPFDLDAARRFLAFLLPKLPADRLDGKPRGPPGGPRGSAGVRGGSLGGPRGLAGVPPGVLGGPRGSAGGADHLADHLDGKHRGSAGVRRGPLGHPRGFEVGR